VCGGEGRAALHIGPASYSAPPPPPAAPPLPLTPPLPPPRRSEASAEDDDAPKAPDTVKDFDFSPLHQDKLLALTTSNGVLELWDLPAGKLFSSMRMQRSSTFNTANCVQVQDSRGITIEKMSKGGRRGRGAAGAGAPLSRGLGRGWELPRGGDLRTLAREGGGSSGSRVVGGRGCPGR
jgi:hypothetical protein